MTYFSVAIKLPETTVNATIRLEVGLSFLRRQKGAWE
jgi:hypothetical protein